MARIDGDYISLSLHRSNITFIIIIYAMAGSDGGIGGGIGGG